MLALILIIAGVVVLDQVTKRLVVAFLNPDVPFDIIKGVFRFSYVENEGAAFGILNEHRWVFMVISTLAIAALIFYLWKYRPKSRLACTALAFIIGGGIGNMIDRVALGYVIDFLDFCAFPKVWRWVFNVADAFVCIGAGMLILWLILDIIKGSGRETAVKAESKGADAGPVSHGEEKKPDSSDTECKTSAEAACEESEKSGGDTDSK